MMKFTKQIKSKYNNLLLQTFTTMNGREMKLHAKVAPARAVIKGHELDFKGNEHRQDVSSTI